LCRGFAVQLLIDDCFGQAVEARLVVLHSTRPYALDDGAKDGVSFFQVADSMTHGGLDSAEQVPDSV
jgi:hypothetical protein